VIEWGLRDEKAPRSRDHEGSSGEHYRVHSDATMTLRPDHRDGVDPEEAGSVARRD
jgi:hypothetical protein